MIRRRPATALQLQDLHACPEQGTHSHGTVLLHRPLVDTAVMDRTLDTVLDRWNWPGTWGWDYPMMAMAATRLGRPGLAIDALLMREPKNTYLANGNNFQRSKLRIYLPATVRCCWPWP